MDVREIPQSSLSGLDRRFLMDVGPKRASIGLNTLGSGNPARADDSTVSGASGIA
jgi:hypothetical protein